MTPANLSSVIERALLTVLDIDDFESTEGFDGKGIDISGDDWTWLSTTNRKTPPPFPPLSRRTSPARFLPHSVTLPS